MRSSTTLSVLRSSLSGVCAVSKQLPLTHMSSGAKVATAVIAGSGMNARFGETVHCAAAEPHATFVRFGVTDGGEEVAYESALLGRLRRGYRVIQLRSLLGTRIELAHLFVHIVNAGNQLNLWSNPRDQTQLNIRLREENDELKREVAKLRQGEDNWSSRSSVACS